MRREFAPYLAEIDAESAIVEFEDGAQLGAHCVVMATSLTGDMVVPSVLRTTAATVSDWGNGE